MVGKVGIGLDPKGEGGGVKSSHTEAEHSDGNVR